jgi:hypothetical protein
MGLAIAYWLLAKAGVWQVITIIDGSTFLSECGGLERSLAGCFNMPASANKVIRLV